MSEVLYHRKATDFDFKTNVEATEAPLTTSSIKTKILRMKTMKKSNISDVKLRNLQSNLLICDWDDPTEKKYRERIKTPLTAIRAKCVCCMGSQVHEVQNCSKINCPLYPFRMGKNPFYGSSIHTESEE